MTLNFCAPGGEHGAMSARNAIIVLGSINMDLVVRVPRMPRPGETVLGGTFLTNLGGKGANQAVAAARAAERPSLLSPPSVTTPTVAKPGRRLRETNLSLDHVRTLDGQATGVALITVDAAGENMISVASGATPLSASKPWSNCPTRSARSCASC